MAMPPHVAAIVCICACWCAIIGVIAVERHGTLYKEDDTRADNGTLPYATTAIKCVSKCLEEEWCESVNYHDQSKACELTAVKYPAKPGQLDRVKGWKWIHREKIKGKQLYVHIHVFNIYVRFTTLLI
jgi:hypothetical protein